MSKKNRNTRRRRAMAQLQRERLNRKRRAEVARALGAECDCKAIPAITPGITITYTCMHGKTLNT